MCDHWSQIHKYSRSLNAHLDHRVSETERISTRGFQANDRASTESQTRSYPTAHSQINAKHRKEDHHSTKNQTNQPPTQNKPGAKAKHTDTLTHKQKDFENMYMRPKSDRSPQQQRYGFLHWSLRAVLPAMLRCWYSEVSCASRHAASDRRDLRVTSYYTHTNINIYIPSHIRNAHAQFRASLLRIYALPCSCGVCFADNSLSVQNVSMPTTCIRRRQSGFKKKTCLSLFLDWLF